MSQTLSPQLVGDQIYSFGSVWLDELPDNDPYFVQLKIENAAPKGLRATLLIWSDGSLAKVSGAFGTKLSLDTESIEAAYLVGRRALERRYEQLVSEDDKAGDEGTTT